MKIFIDWLKKAITKIEHDNELYVGNQFSTKFDVYFFNVGTDTDWFPTLTQLAPTGREAGPFSADSDSFTTTTIDNVTYLTVTFTMGTGYAFIKGVSSFFLYENRITTPNPTKSVIGKFIVTLNKSDNGYFLDDPEFNPKVKEYVDKYSQLRFGGEASTSVIEALETNQGVWLATDTGYYWYWDYDNNEYVRGNLFQAVSVADGAITTAKIADGAVTTAKIPQGAITDTKLAGPLALKIANSIQNGENNPTVNSNVHTYIFNSNSMESDTDESYGSQIDLSLDKAIVGHSFYSNGTTKYSKVEFDEYHDNTDNDDYPRAVIETKYEYDSTPEISKITILKDLIELLSGGKITIQADDDIEIKTDSAHTIIIRGCVDFYDDIWAHNSYITGQDIFAERTLYENNKRVATKEYVQQIEAALQAQINASGLTPSDIADNLTTNDSTKVLSAAQGVVLKGFIDSINTLLQCDDTTLDEIQEIVDYIKNNKSLIDGITTSKVNVSDIINNLTSTATNKPLSAAMGKVLKDTLDSVQASISALTSNKQDKIDSSHKLDADLVAENSSRVFVTPTQKQQIGTNASDISSLDGRVTNLENNPTSNVSGTNDGTNWTSITIGNETYAIPSGSSGGSSTSSGAYYEIKTSDIAFYDENGTQITNDVLDNLRITLSEGQFEALKVKMGLPSSATINDLLTQVNSTFTETSASASNTAYQALVALSGYCQFWSTDNNVIFEFALMTFGYGLQALGGNKQYSWFTMVDGNDTPMGISATWTLTQYGTSGGSSSSESYYKIELTDYNVADNIEEKLILMLEPSDFNAVLTEINTQMGTSLSTPQDLITFYDSVKGNNTYYGGCCLLFATMCELCIINDTNAVFVDYDLKAYNKITMAIGSPIPSVGSNNMVVISALNPDNNTSITFTSSSTLTITEQTNQKI